MRRRSFPNYANPHHSRRREVRIESHYSFIKTIANFVRYSLLYRGTDMKFQLGMGFLKRRHTEGQFPQSLSSSVRPSPEEAMKWAESFQDLMASKCKQTDWIIIPIPAFLILLFCSLNRNLLLRNRRKKLNLLISFLSRWAISLPSVPPTWIQPWEYRGKWFKLIVFNTLWIVIDFKTKRPDSTLLTNWTPI